MLGIWGLRVVGSGLGLGFRGRRVSLLGVQVYPASKKLQGLRTGALGLPHCCM